ncbi:hypothetical protein EG831_06830 [bacterium]|nr:hypothetical protein [bacterium]
MRPLHPAGVHYAKDAMDGLRVLNQIVGEPAEKPGSMIIKRKQKTKRDVSPQGKTKQPVGRQRFHDSAVVRKMPRMVLFANLDKNALFEKRWKLGRLSHQQRLEAETRLVGLWRVLRPMIKPKAVYTVVHAGDLHFESGLLQKQTVFGVQLVTLGTDLRTIKGTGEEKYLLHGLAAELTETLARWCDARLARENHWQRTRRISPGYPVWPDLSEQKKIFALLKPGRIGVRLTRAHQMVPEYTTSAAVLPR